VVLDGGLFLPHLTNLKATLSREAIRVAGERAISAPALGLVAAAGEVIGLVAVSQTCDIIRSTSKVRVTALDLDLTVIGQTDLKHRIHGLIASKFLRALSKRRISA